MVFGAPVQQQNNNILRKCKSNTVLNSCRLWLYRFQINEKYFYKYLVDISKKGKYLKKKLFPEDIAILRGTS